MGCCFKKKTNLLINNDLYNYDVDDDFVIYSKEELFIFEEAKARKLVKLLLTNDHYRYSQFLDIVLSFDKEELQKLFEGEEEYIYSKINYYEKEDFNLLIIKFDNYNNIIDQWYRDESKHKYIDKLWKKNIKMYSFKNKYKYEIRNEIQNIMEFLPNEYNIKEELITLIENSPETKADDLKYYIRNNRPDFYELIDTATTYQKKIKESDLEDKSNFIDNLKFIINNGFCGIKKLFKDYLEKNGGYKKISNSLINKFQKVLLKNFESQAGIDKYGFDTVLNLGKGFQNFVNISNSISKYYNNSSLCLATLSISFFNLCTSIMDFYKCFEEFKTVKNQYSNRLNQIHDDFIRHKGEITKFTNLSNSKEYIENIIEIGHKISQDKQNILGLISEIENTIIIAENRKGKNIGGIILGTIGFVFGAVGAVFGVGAPAICYGVAAIINGVNVAISSGNIVQIKNQIKEYKSILEKANNEYDKIEEEIKSLVRICDQIYDAYIPVV